MSLTSAKKLILAAGARGGAIPIARARRGARFYSAGKYPNPDFLCDVMFRPNGRQMYVTNYNTVYEFALSTAWDVATATYTGRQLGTVSGNAFDSKSDFASDGLRIFQASYYFGTQESRATILTRTLQTAWTLGPATDAVRDFPFTIDGADRFLRGVRMSPDGLQMILNYSGGYLRHFNLSAPFDPASAVASGKVFKVAGTSPDIRGFSFSSNGKSMLACEGDSNGQVVIRDYALAGAFDVSTAKARGLARDATGDGEGATALFMTSDTKIAFLVFNPQGEGGDNVLTLDMR